MYQNFKASFAHLNNLAALDQPIPADDDDAAADALDLSLDDRYDTPPRPLRRPLIFSPRHLPDDLDSKDLTFSPQGFSMDWKPTPSYHDSEPASHMNAHWSAYYPPTPGGPGVTLAHNQPNILGLGTPLSRPVSQPALYASQSAALTMQDFHLQHMASPRSFPKPVMYHGAPAYQPDHTYDMTSQQNHHFPANHSALVRPHAMSAQVASSGAYPTHIPVGSNTVQDNIDDRFALPTARLSFPSNRSANVTP